MSKTVNNLEVYTILNVLARTKQVIIYFLISFPSKKVFPTTNFIFK